MQSHKLEKRNRAVMREVLSRKDASDAQLLRQVNEYLKQCFRDESPPHVSELASKLGLSISALSRRFRATGGVMLSTYFKDQQVACAQRLLRLKRHSVDRIGRKAGFGTQRTFFRAFKQRTGLTPEEYRVRYAATSPR